MLPLQMTTKLRQLRRIVIMHTPLKLMQLLQYLQPRHLQLLLRPKYYPDIQVMRLFLYLLLVQRLKSVIYL